MRCARCGFTNTQAATSCKKCGLSLQTHVDTPPRDSRSGCAVPIAVAIGFGGGTGTLFVLFQLFGEERIRNSDMALFWGFTLGFTATLLLVFRVMKPLGRDAGTGSVSRDVVAALEKPPGRGDRRILPWFAGVLFLTGCLAWWDLYSWEMTGGTKRFKGLYLALYLMLGKWGIAALLWVGAGAIVGYLLSHKASSGERPRK